MTTITDIRLRLDLNGSPAINYKPILIFATVGQHQLPIVSAVGLQSAIKLLAKWHQSHDTVPEEDRQNLADVISDVEMARQINDTLTPKDL